VATTVPLSAATVGTEITGPPDSFAFWVIQ
jgi:hypothetical protein